MLFRSVRRVGLAGALLAFTLPLPPVRAAQEPSGPEDLFGTMARLAAEAERSLASGEKQIAESRYRSALYEGWLLLGRIEEAAGDPAAARRAYDAASASAVDARRARMALALLLVEQRQSDEAELVLRELIEDDASDFEARRLLSKALAEADRLEAAVQELEQLRYLSGGDPESSYLLATAYLEQGRVEDAEQLLDEIAASLPTPQTHILIGRTYRDADLFGKAQEALQAALALDPKVRRAHYYLGTIHLLDEGTAALEAAEREFEQELRIAPDDVMSHMFLGMALVESRRFEAAIPHLEVASERAALRADALRFLGRAQLETGELEAAISTLRRGLEAAADARSSAAEPTEFEARQLSSLHYQLGQALRRSGEADEAGIHFDEAKRYQARSAEGARETLGRYLSDADSEPAEASLASPADPRVAPEQLEAVRSRIETFLARVYLNLGVLQARDEKHARAAELFARAAELAPSLPGLQYSLGVSLFNSGSFERATGPLTRALEHGGDDGPVTEMLALAWLNAGEPEKAAELLAATPGRESDPGLQYSYGLALIRSGQAAAAAEVFQRLLRDNADWPELNVVLGKAFAQQGDYEAAAESLRRALDLDPRVAEAHATLGEMHLRKGELEEAEAELRAELRAHPEDSRAAYTLATVLDLAQKPDEAMTVLQALLADEPGLAKGRYLLGKILLSRGEPQAALEQLEAAAGLSPDDANTRYQLGQAYQKLGRRAEAEREFEAFRELKDERRGGEDS